MITYNIQLVKQLLKTYFDLDEMTTQTTELGFVYIYKSHAKFLLQIYEYPHKNYFCVDHESYFHSSIYVNFDKQSFFDLLEWLNEKNSEFFHRSIIKSIKAYLNKEEKKTTCEDCQWFQGKDQRCIENGIYNGYMAYYITVKCTRFKLKESAPEPKPSVPSCSNCIYYRGMNTGCEKHYYVDNIIPCKKYARSINNQVETISNNAEKLEKEVQTEIYYPDMPSPIPIVKKEIKSSKDNLDSSISKDNEQTKLIEILQKEKISLQKEIIFSNELREKYKSKLDRQLQKITTKMNALIVKEYLWKMIFVLLWFFIGIFILNLKDDIWGVMYCVTIILPLIIISMIRNRREDQLQTEYNELIS